MLFIKLNTRVNGMSCGKNKTLTLVFFIAAVSMLAYSQFFGMQLMEFDSVIKIVSHSGTDFGEVVNIFTQPEENFFFISVNYRPVGSLLYWFVFMLYGLNFSAFHLLCFALHALNSVLVFFLARKLIRDKSGFFSLIAALAFALNPINLNSVLFISRLHEPLILFALLASLLFLKKFFEEKKQRFFLISIFFCGLGIFSKETGCLIPFVLFSYCFVFLKEKTILRRLTRSLKLCVPFFSLIALYFALMLFSLGRIGGYTNQFVPNNARASIIFFKLLFYPVGFLKIDLLKPIYALLVNPFAFVPVLISVIAITAFALWFFSRKKKDKPVLFLFLWFFIFLFFFSAFGLMMPWYSYVPLVPFVLLLSIFLERNCKRFCKSNLSKILSFFIAFLFISFFLFSPLFVSYEQPLAAGKMTQSVLSQTVNAAEMLPDESTIYLVNYPAILFFPEKGFDYQFFMVNWASVQAMLDFSFPQKNLDVFSLSSSTILDLGLDENQFSFSQKDNCVFLLESKKDLYRKTARIFPAMFWARGQINSREITVNFDHTLEFESIEITLPEQDCKNAFLLFFDGKDVKTFKASNFS